MKEVLHESSQFSSYCKLQTSVLKLNCFDIGSQHLESNVAGIAGFENVPSFSFNIKYGFSGLKGAKEGGILKKCKSPTSG